MTPVLCYNPPRRSPPRPEVDIDAAQFVSERGRSLAVPIVMPQLGMVMTEGVIAKWTKSPGDVVASGEVIAEIETEKLNYDLEATESGIFHPVVPEGAVVLVDGVAGYLLAEGEEVPETLPETPSPVTSGADHDSKTSGETIAGPRRAGPLHSRRQESGGEPRSRHQPGHSYRPGRTRRGRKTSGPLGNSRRL